MICQRCEFIKIIVLIVFLIIWHSFIYVNFQLFNYLFYLHGFFVFFYVKFSEMSAKNESHDMMSEEIYQDLCSTRSTVSALEV